MSEHLYATWQRTWYVMEIVTQHFFSREEKYAAGTSTYYMKLARIDNSD
jgi:hypothetical protein